MFYAGRAKNFPSLSALNLPACKTNTSIFSIPFEQVGSLPYLIVIFNI